MSTLQPTPSIMKKHPDVLVIGAGIFGLWAARHAILAGKQVQVVERSQVGAGASGGFLGALMPHMPDTWNAKKQMQFSALCALPDAVAALEADTGLSVGYRRCGRLMPLKHDTLVEVATKRVVGAQDNWGEFARMEILPPGFAGSMAEGWLSEAVSPFGAVYDTLSARIDPRAYLAALASFVRTNGALDEGIEVVSIDTEQGRVGFADGSFSSAEEVIVANGFEAYPMLAGARVGRQEIVGTGVKGQAVLLEYSHADDLPIVYDDGSYVVPHPGHRIAVGSTSVNHWTGAPENFDETDMRFLDYARMLVPAIAEAPVIERWAAVRPRNTMADPETGRTGTEPLFGSLDGNGRVKVALGGFKISFGIAHLDWLGETHPKAS